MLIMLHQSDIYSKISMNHFDISTFLSIKNSSNDKPLMTVCVCVWHTQEKWEMTQVYQWFTLLLLFFSFFSHQREKTLSIFRIMCWILNFIQNFVIIITFLLMYDMPNLRRLSLEKMTDPYDALLCNLVIAIQLLTWRHSANIIFIS